jgi:type II secretory pathway pseudopilin PulG
MMTPNQKPHHKMFGMPQASRKSLLSQRRPEVRSGETGYTLVALLALMTLMAMFAAAAAPSIVQQAQREREKEAIFRGEQVADAIRVYYAYRVRIVGGGNAQAALPTSIDQLLEGVPSGTKKRQILRASAARDPLSTSGEWRLVKPLSSELADFERSLMLYAGNILPDARDPQINALQRVAALQLAGIVNLGSGTSSSADNTSDNSTGPFIGVTSRSKRNSVITYYGIDRHSQWIFTPLFR